MLIATTTLWEAMLTLCLVHSDEDDLAFKEKQKKEAAELKALASKGRFSRSRSEFRMSLMGLCSRAEGSYGRCWPQEVGIHSGLFLLPFRANVLVLGLPRSKLTHHATSVVLK